MTISDTRLRTMCKSNNIAEGVEVYRGCIKECLSLPLPCWGAPSLSGWWFLVTWTRGEHSLQVRTTLSLQQCDCAAVAFVNLLQVFEESFAQILADVLRYQTVSKAQKVFYVDKTRRRKAVSSCRIINMQYCCHLLASCGSANAKWNKRGIQASVKI